MLLLKRHLPIVARARVQRSLFGIFGRRGKDREQNIPSTIIDKAKDRKEGTYNKEDSPTSNTPMTKDEEFVALRDKYFVGLRQEREKMETELEKRKREIEEATLRNRREFEVTIKNLDYKKVIIDNAKSFDFNEFESIEELSDFVSQLNYRLTEENIGKIIRGYLGFAEIIEIEDLAGSGYLIFMDILRRDIGYIKDKENIINIARFMDLFCVSYPEVWVKFEEKIMKMKDYFTTKEIIQLLSHFSNQGEGSERFYDHFERIISENLASVSMEDQCVVVQSYFNVRKGTPAFFKAIFQSLNNRLKNEDIKDTSIITKLALVMSESEDDEIEDFCNEIYKTTEKIVAKHLYDLSLEKLCLIANGFGDNKGSREFFMMLEMQIRQLANLEEFQDVKLILHGLAFNYRISREFLIELSQKILAFQNHLTPFELAKLVRVYDILQVGDEKTLGQIEGIVLHILRNNSDQLTDEHLFELCLSYNMTRKGSRELHKTLEYIVNLRVERIGMNNPELIGKFYVLYTNSGLVSPETLKKIEEYV